MRNVLNEEQARKELADFLNEYAEKEITADDVHEIAPLVLDALMAGNLVLDQKPRYTLLKPIKNDAGEITLSELEFKTRILPTTYAELGKGLDIQKEIMRFNLVCVAHIIGQPYKMLDKFSRKDYEFIQQFGMLFT